MSKTRFFSTTTSIMEYLKKGLRSLFMHPLPFANSFTFLSGYSVVNPWDRCYINLVYAISIRFTVKRIYCFSWPIFRCPILYQNIPWTYFVHGMMTKGIQLRGDQLRQKLRPLVLYYIASPCLAIESSVPLSFLSPSCLAPRAVVVLGWEARQKLRPLVLKNLIMTAGLFIPRYLNTLWTMIARRVPKLSSWASEASRRIWKSRRFRYLRSFDFGSASAQDDKTERQNTPRTSRPRGAALWIQLCRVRRDRERPCRKAAHRMHEWGQNSSL